MKNRLKKIFLYSKKNKSFLGFLLISFLVFSFFRNYQLEERAQFTWDQVDNAWHAKNLLVDGVYPLTGMPAKQNSSVSIGPAYYYLVSLFYFVSRLDPVASPILASFTSVLSFIALFFVGSKVFNKWVGLISVIIVSVSSYLIEFDRVQWPVGFIPAIGSLIYLSLYKISRKEYGYIFALAFLLGFSLHIHFTSIFYFAICLLFVPFLPRNRKMILYSFYALPILLLWMSTFFITLFQSNNNTNILGFFAENNVGLHLRRVIQVSEIAFSENSFIFGKIVPDFVRYIIFPLFVILLFVDKGRKNLSILYLSAIWVGVPLILLSMFRGDLTPYYFSMYRFVSVIMFSYIIYFLIKFRRNIFLPLFVLFFTIYAYSNLLHFFDKKSPGLLEMKRMTLEKYKRGEKNEFTYGSGETYLFYFFEKSEVEKY